MSLVVITKLGLKLKLHIVQTTICIKVIKRHILGTFLCLEINSVALSARLVAAGNVAIEAITPVSLERCSIKVAEQHPR